MAEGHQYKQEQIHGWRPTEHWGADGLLDTKAIIARRPTRHKSDNRKKGLITPIRYVWLTAMAEGQQKQKPNHNNCPEAPIDIFFSLHFTSTFSSLYVYSPQIEGLWLDTGYPGPHCRKYTGTWAVASQVWGSPETLVSNKSCHPILPLYNIHKLLYYNVARALQEPQWCPQKSFAKPGRPESIRRQLWRLPRIQDRQRQDPEDERLNQGKFIINFRTIYLLNTHMHSSQTYQKHPQRTSRFEENEDIANIKMTYSRTIEWPKTALKALT